MTNVVEGGLKVRGRHLQFPAREDWLGGRKPLIGGTDAAKILGVSRFGTAMDVYLDKTGKHTEDVGADRAMWRSSGLRLERPILEWYADQNAVPILFTPHSITLSPDRPEVIGVSLDAVRQDGDPCPPVDGKNIRFRDAEWGESMSDQMPVYYAAQLVMQMHVTGAEFADLAVLFSGQELEVYRIWRDTSLEQDMVDRVVEFHQKHIVADVPPPVDSSPAYADYLGRKFLKHTETMLPATADQRKVALELVTVREDQKRLEQQRTLLENLLKTAIADALGITGEDFKITWSKTKDGVTLDYEGAFTKLESDVRLLIAGAAANGTTITRSDIDTVVADAKRVFTKEKKGFRRFLLTTKKAGSE